MIQHVIIAVIFFIIGTAWGCGIACMLAANNRRKRLFAARQRVAEEVTGDAPQTAEQPFRLQRAYGVIKADSTGRLYLEKFDA